MVPSRQTPTPPVSAPPARPPLSILRTETVLSRFPIHTLTKCGRVTIHITQTDAQGALDVQWTVAYNEHYGPPRQLAYKLDTVVINQCLDALPRPLPCVIPVGSLTQVCRRLGLADSGRQQAELKHAFHQNASAYIVAYLRYRGRDGTVRTVNRGFTRYSVVFTGERLPDDTAADGICLVLNETYREVLNQAPVRPLDYAYLKELPPMAQRFYELLSYKMFATLKHRRPRATLRYTDYCLLSTQQRYTVAIAMQKQMYKVHRPHVASGYLTAVHYEATTDADGGPDWFMHYTPGPKARDEFAAFTRQSGHEGTRTRVATGEDGQEARVATVVQERPARRPPALPAASTGASDATTPPACQMEPPPSTRVDVQPPASTDPMEAQAQALVDAFHQRFHGRAPGTAHPKELAHATQLLTEHGATTAHFLLTYAQQAAPETAYQPKFFGGILPYLPEALAAYDAQARQAAQRRTQQAAAREQRCHERYLAWQQEQCAQLRAALPSTALMALEDAQRARLTGGRHRPRWPWTSPSAWLSTTPWRPRPSCPRSRCGGSRRRYAEAIWGDRRPTRTPACGAGGAAWCSACSSSRPW